MSTLNGLGYEALKLAGYVDDTSIEYYNLHEIAKNLFKDKFATYIRRDAERNGGGDAIMQQTIVVKLIEVDKSEASCYPVNCNILRTENKIPNPVRVRSSSPFSFVGYVDRSKSFPQTSLEELPFTYMNDFSALDIRYDYKNRYIYIFNEKKIKRIAVEAIFAEFAKGDVCVDNICYNEPDEYEFPASNDIVNFLRIEVVNELKSINAKYDRAT